jgi:ADP-heptose:LPS heptosyltransferase
MKAFRRRRRHVDHMNGEPLLRRIGRKIEQRNKQLTIRLMSAWIRVRKLHAPIDPLSISKVLVIRTDAIGDMVLSTSIWRVLKKHYPHLTIGVVGSFRNLGVIANDPDVDMAFELEDMKPRSIFRLSSRVRATKWDLVLPLIYNRKTKMSILSKLFAPKAIASMLLFRDDPVEHYNRLFSIVVKSGMLMDKQPILDLMKVHLEGTVAIQISDEEWRPSLYPNEKSVLLVQSMIEEKLLEDKTDGFIHINLEARTPFREFGIENSYELSRRLRARFPNLSVLWTASPASSAAIEEFLSTNRVEGIHFQRSENIDELIGLVRHSMLVITPDTSVVHIASAERKPVVALLRYYSEWHPYKVPNYVLIPPYGEAVSSIPIEKVFEAAESLLIHSHIIHLTDLNTDNGT